VSRGALSVSNSVGGADGGTVNELLIQMQSFDQPTAIAKLWYGLIQKINGYLPAGRRVGTRPTAYSNIMVIAATNQIEINIRVSEDAEARSMLVNVVDVPPLCNFILPAIVRSGPLAIAISTAGASPALAKRMKREIAEAFGEPYARLAVMLNDARGWAKATLPTYQDRKEFFEGIVNGEPDPVQLVREGRESEVLALIEAAKESHAAAAADG